MYVCVLAQFAWDYGRAIHVWTPPARASTGCTRRSMHVPQRHWPDRGPADTQEGREDAEHDERHTSGHGPHHEHDGAYATRECGGQGGHQAPLIPIKG